ncbi:MAG: hypothetical protein M5U34_36405 [Chloroflexi bacterium]|nr:hypothetical protein [Chloroflexota bacterium]
MTIEIPELPTAVPPTSTPQPSPTPAQWTLPPATPFGDLVGVPGTDIAVGGKRFKAVLAVVHKENGVMAI